jgi:hypothetical protein
MPCTARTANAPAASRPPPTPAPHHSFPSAPLRQDVPAPLAGPAPPASRLTAQNISPFNAAYEIARTRVCGGSGEPELDALTIATVNRYTYGLGEVGFDRSGVCVICVICSAPVAWGRIDLTWRAGLVCSSHATRGHLPRPVLHAPRLISNNPTA